MSDEGTHDSPDQGEAGNVDKTRRRLLVGSTAVVGGIGVAGAAIPFVRSWNPSAKARALGAPIEVDISKLNPGEMLGPIPAWRGRPVFVIRRTPETIEELASDNPRTRRSGFKKRGDAARVCEEFVALEEAGDRRLRLGSAPTLAARPSFAARTTPFSASVTDRSSILQGGCSRTSRRRTTCQSRRTVSRRTT